MTRNLLVAVPLSSALALASCALDDAAFGRVCDDDDDCAGQARDADLVCLPVVVAGGADEKRCVTPTIATDVSTGETCRTAIPLALDARTPGTTGDALNELDAICGGADAADRAYRIDLATTTNLRVTLEPDGFDGLLYASLADDCGVIVSGACRDFDHSSGGTEVMVLPAVGPGRIYLVVDGAASGLGASAGSFHITVSEDLSCESGFVSAAGACVGVVAEVEQAVARTNAAATLLQDGRVLVTGGRTGSDLATTATAELFDPATDTFAPTDSLAVDRARHCSERMADGRVLIAGGVRGRDGDYAPTASVEIFDPATDTFSPGPDLPRARDLFSCTELDPGDDGVAGHDGVFVAGGRDGDVTLDDAWLLDPAATIWTAQDALLEPRFGHLAFLPDVDDDPILVGGRVGSAALALDTVENYAVVAGDTDPLEPMGEPRAGACGAVLDNNRVLVVGGYRGSFDDEIVGQASAEIYDLDDDQWTGVFGDMTEPRLFASCSFVPGLGVVVVGGSQDDPTGSVDLFSEDDDAFLPLAPLRHPRLAHVTVTLLDGRLLIIGGDGGDANTTTPLSTAELIGRR